MTEFIHNHGAQIVFGLGVLSILFLVFRPKEDDEYEQDI